jgi:hypothetical protein
MTVTRRGLREDETRWRFGFPGVCDTGDPTGPVEAYRLMSRGRGATLQSKVGYVDARPLNRQLDEVLLQHRPRPGARRERYPCFGVLLIVRFVITF